MHSMHLSVKRPSETTVLFTVSNASPRDTITARLLYYLTVLFRAVAVLSTTILLVIKSRCTAKEHDINYFLPECAFWLPKKIPVLIDAATHSSWQHVLPVSLVILFLCFRRFHTGEGIYFILVDDGYMFNV
jgi:phosphatidylinositol glycan class H protein